MKRILLAAAAVGMLALGTPAAMAAPGDTQVGGCSFSANSPPNSNDTFTGEIDIFSVTYNQASGPVAATVTCELKVNGSVVGTLSASGTGVQANAGPVSYVAPEGSTTELCTTTDFGGGDVRTDCGDATEVEIPPQVVQDLIVQITSIPDPLLCPQLAALAGSYGVVTIGPDGDITFVDPIGFFWDCPPYAPPA